MVSVQESGAGIRVAVINGTALERNRVLLFKVNWRILTGEVHMNEEE